MSQQKHYHFLLVDDNDNVVQPRIEWEAWSWNFDEAFNARPGVTLPNSGIVRVTNKTEKTTFHLDWSGKRDGSPIPSHSFILAHRRYMGRGY